MVYRYVQKMDKRTLKYRRPERMSFLNSVVLSKTTRGDLIAEADDDDDVADDDKNDDDSYPPIPRNWSETMDSLFLSIYRDPPLQHREQQNLNRVTTVAKRFAQQSAHALPDYLS